MADLSLADALTEPPPEIEEEIKRDFIATLEAEAFDDVVGETVGKTDYIPLLDVDEKTGNSESKKKPCSDTSQVEGTPSSKPTVLANGDHGIEGNTTGSPTEFLEEKMAYQGYQNNQNWPEDTNFCFEPEQVVNPIQTDPFKMHHDDGLEDLLFLPSGTTSTSSFTEQNDPLKDSYGLFPCDTFAPAAVAPEGWSVEAPNPPHLESLISLDAITQPLQPTAEPADIEMTSAEEKTPTKALEVIMGLKASDMAPSRESEIVPAKDVAPASETEVALTKDMEPPTKSDTALVKDMGMEEALVKDVVLPTETEVAPAKDVTLFKETERTPPVKMDLAPADDVAPPTDREMTPAKDVASLSEIGVALAKDVVSSTEIASAKEVALSSETEVALVKDVTPTPETEVTPVKDMTPPPEIKMALGKDVAPPETEVAPVKDMVSPPETEMALGKNVALPSETEKALGKDVVSPLETEMAPGKNVALSPETEMALGKDVVSPPETEVTLAEDVALPSGTEVTLANNVAPTKDVAASSEAEVAPVPVKDMEIARAQEETSEDSQLESLQVEGQSVAPTLMISPEPVTAMGQKYSLPVDEDSMFEKLEQKKLLSSPPSELSSETSGVLPSQPTMVGTEHGLVSRENLKKECDIDSRTAKLAAENLSSESISTPSCPLQELLKTAGNSQPRLSVAAEVKDNPLESSLKEVNDENEMTKQHNDKQKEFSEGGEQVKELKKEAIPKQRHENSIFASEQLQDKVLVQGPGLGNEPLKRMADSQKDSGAVLVPEEPAPKAERMTAGDKSEELGPDFPKQPGTLADLTEGVVVGEPKEMTDLRVAGPLQPLTLWGHGSDVVQTSVARTERGAMATDTLAESSQETAPAQISTVVVVDNCSKDGAAEEERPKAPSAVTPSTSTGGVAPTSTAAEETVNSHGEPAEGLLPPGVPVGDQSLAGEVRVPQARADRSNFPTCPVNKRKESEEGSAAVPIPNLLGDKTQKPPFREDQNARERVSKGPDSLIMEVDGPPKSEKAKLEEISLASEITELESVSLAPPELQSDVFSGRVEATPSRVVDKLVVTASKSPQVPEPKDKILEAPEKMTEKSEPKAPGEGKKEDKGRMAEPMKGYMRPTKSRGLTPLLPKSTVQERERSKQLKSSGMNLPCGNVCACGFWSVSKRQRACALVPSKL
ncbi:microtubule-associated protein 4 [Camelus ferus]|nr:microtubule-associated protein 4 [Camelus ferus]